MMTEQHTSAIITASYTFKEVPEMTGKKKLIAVLSALVMLLAPVTFREED